MSDRILATAAHPEGELLGDGGTIALHARRDHQVTAVIACEGESIRYSSNGVGQADHVARAADALGIARIQADQHGLDAGEISLTIGKNGRTPV